MIAGIQNGSTPQDCIVHSPTAFTQPDAYFRRYADLSDEQAVKVAAGIWEKVNAVNLVENILPTRDRASLILEKAGDHTVRKVRLRR